MAFWGIEVQEGKPYTHRYDSEQGRLKVSQATLGIGSSTKKSIVQCSVGDKRPIYLCSFLPEKLETCPLNLEFEEYDKVTFSVVGPHSVYLSGFFYGGSQDNTDDDYGSDSYDEDIVYTASNEDESTDNDTEDEYEDEFGDDDLEMYPPSPLPNSGVKIEEILDDEKPAGENGKRPKKKKNNQLGRSNDNDNTQRQLVVKSGTGVPVLESEDEDGFPISSPGKSEAHVLNAKEKAGEKDKRTSEKTKKKITQDESLKRKIEAVIQDGEQAREAGQPFDYSVPTTEAIPEDNVKQKKKNKKRKVSGNEEKAHKAGAGSNSGIEPEDATTTDMDEAVLVGDEKSPGIDSNSVTVENHSEEKKKKKNKKKSKKQESLADANIKQSVTDTNERTTEMEEKAETKPFQVRSFSNGLVIEELTMGKPDGKKAAPGKKVSVHYIGKLKKNGKIFNSNIGRAPFKFRLGVGQVIKGWDVGVNGMRVGDKRRLTIPPAMGYGAQGAGGVIPPNSWLVFDVELVDVS